jgi:hypothetical protein
MAVLGKRHWYRYNLDDGTSYKIQMLDYLAEAAGLELNDSAPDLPNGYEPRFVWLQEANPKSRRPIRKKLIIQKKDASRFQRGSLVEVAGVKMVVQSYKGESRRRVGRNDGEISKVRVEIFPDRTDG